MEFSLTDVVHIINVFISNSPWFHAPLSGCFPSMCMLYWCIYESRSPPLMYITLNLFTLNLICHIVQMHSLHLEKFFCYTSKLVWATTMWNHLVSTANLATFPASPGLQIVYEQISQYRTLCVFILHFILRTICTYPTLTIFEGVTHPQGYLFSNSMTAKFIYELLVRDFVKRLFSHWL